MDPMAFLDMERRTGISSKEVDDFAQRMDMVAEAMEQIKAGTFDPENCKIPGYKSPAQEAREAEERARKEEERKKKEAEKKRKQKEDERQQWWSRAKLRFAIERGDGDLEDGIQQSEPVDKKKEATKWANRVLAAYKARDANDYSLWDNWVPEDPATLEERAAREAALDKVRNDEFEKNNPDFCRQFKDDIEKRQQNQRERERDAEKLKLAGNRHYKRREYEQAIAEYMKALEKSPFNVAVLTNIAQCFLRLELLDDSVEFSSRALYVNPDHVKALSRRAAVYHRQKKWEEAAQDMERALLLDPTNEDVVEQHSIVVGDFEDAIAQNQLETKLRNETASVNELKSVMDILGNIDTLESASDSDRSKSTVQDRWSSYEKVAPVLERSSDARDWMRTSNELAKLIHRLIAALESSQEKWKTAGAQQEASENDLRAEETTLAEMLHTAAACLTQSPRNQVVLYRGTRFRNLLMSLLGRRDNVDLELLPIGIREMILRFFEEAVDCKSWKRDIIGSEGALSALLTVVATGFDRNKLSGRQINSLLKSAVSASSILLTISGDDPLGIKALVANSSCLVSIADGLQAHRRSTAILSNLLGMLSNLSTHAVIRTFLDKEDSTIAKSLRPRLVRSLLVLSAHFTTASLTPQKRAVYRSCAERALAALLNFSHQANSLVRSEMLRQQVMPALGSVLDYISGRNVDELMLVASRSISLLCRLHILPDPMDGDSVHTEMTSTTLLDRLYKICQLSLPSFAATSTIAASTELWQTHAQIWCHVGWCISLPGMESRMQAYLRSKEALPAMLETVDLVNAQRLYRRLGNESATGPERITGNVVKVLISMLPHASSHDKDQDATFWSRKSNLKVLVDALQDLPDGLARKNVAILLAKLCQVFGSGVKDTLRELRGIEMMLSVSKSLQMPTKSRTTTAKPKAVAF